MEGKVIKKTKKKWLVALAIIFMVPVLLLGIVSLPMVQTFIAKRLAAYLSSELNAEVSIERVRITFALNARIRGLSVQDQEGNDLFAAKEIFVDVDRLGLRSRELDIKKIIIRNLAFNAKKYEGHDLLNFQFLVDYFSPDEEDPDQEPWMVSVNSVEVINSMLSFSDFNSQRQPKGFDPSFFALQNVSFNAGNFFVRNDTVAFELQRLSFVESENLELKNLSASWFISDSTAKASNLLLSTNSSRLELEASFEFENGKGELDFFQDVGLDISVNNSTIELGELGYIVSSLYGIEGQVSIAGNFRGNPSNIRGSDISITNEEGTSLKGNFHLTGLPLISETFFMVTAQELKTSIRDIASFKLPESIPTRNIVVPAELAPLGQINFRGNLTGFLNDFVAFGNFRTSIGQVSTDILVRQNANPRGFSFSGRLITNNFNIGRIANFEKLGNISMDATMSGGGTSFSNASVEMTGTIKHLELFDYHYENIAISGDFSNRRFNGALAIDDPNVNLDFKGVVNFEEDIPTFNFNASLENANLSLLNIYQREEPLQSLLSGTFEINAKASGIDDWIGKATINSLKYQEMLPNGEVAGSFESSFFELENTALNGDQKQISLNSDFIDAKMTGVFRFDRVTQSVESFINSYVPAFLTGKNITANENSFANTSFEIHFKNTDEVTNIFTPFLKIANGTTIYGEFGQAVGDLTLNVTIPELSIAGSHFHNGTMIASRYGEAYRFLIEFENAVHSENIFMEKFRLSGNIDNNVVSTDLRWNNESTARGNFGNIVNEFKILDNQNIKARVLPSYLVLNDGNWFVNTDNLFEFGPTGVKITCFELQGDWYSLVIDGKIGAEPEDKLVFSIDEIEAKTLWDLVDDDYFDFGGSISGIVSLSSMLSTTNLTADIKIDEFEFNNVVVGDLELNSFLDRPYEAFRVNLVVTDQYEGIDFQPISARGSIYTGQRDENFDLTIDVNNLDLELWSRYLGEVANTFTGKTTGRLRLGGPFNYATLIGRLRVEDGLMEVAPLNTTVRFANDVIFEKDRFVFNNLSLTDKFGNTGNLSGGLNHVGLTTWGLDIDIGMSNFLVMDLPQDWTSVVFGTAFATGNARIHSLGDEITIDLNARSSRGTQVFFPVPEGDWLQDRSFISFINHNPEENPVEALVEEEGFVNLNLDLEVTPDAEMQIILDPRTGELIRGRGDGNLRINVAANYDFTMFGDLTIEEGDYIFKLQDIITRRFRIEPGGTIAWFGHPLDAEVNIRTTLPVKASLFELFAGFGDLSDAYRRRVPVEVNLLLTEKLYPSTLTFDINIPGAGEEVNRRLEEIISTEQELANQVFALLVFQRFIPAGSGLFDPGLLGSSLGVGTTTELLTSQINNWLSQISRDLDIGLKFRPGDHIAGQEVEVVVSKRLFDNRLLIDGSLGYAANNPYLQRTSNIIGDFNVEYKLNLEGFWRLRAFNRTNTFDIENLSSPYTQGIGIFFRRELNRFSELFRTRPNDANTPPAQPEVESEDQEE